MIHLVGGCKNSRQKREMCVRRVRNECQAFTRCLGGTSEALSSRRSDYHLTSLYGPFGPEL